MNIKKTASSLFVLILIVGLVITFLPFGANRTEAAVSSWYKSASVYPRWNTDFGSDSFKQSLQDLKASGATMVALVYPIYQSNDQASDIGPGGDTPTDASLIAGINYAHSIGLQVMLKPHLGSYGGFWRASINASDRNAWFTNYGNMLNHLGDIGKQTGVESMCIGTELISMSTYTSNGDNTQRWQTMIGSLRTHFSGWLTYSANWGSGDFAEEVPHIGFWGSLDYMGISAYYPLSGSSVQDFVNSWSGWDSSKVQPLYNQFHKPIIFTEIGYRSLDGTNNDPWDGGRGGNVNLTLQSNLYQAMFTYWNSKSYIAGVNLWDWSSDPNAGGSGDNHYVPQHKPALDIIKQWFAGGTTPPPPPPASGAWNESATVSGSTTNNPVTFNLNITNTGSTNDVIVDGEIYDSSGNRVKQQFFDHQNISSTAPGNYSIAFTPTAAGTYTLRGGVFNNDWTQNYIWSNNIASVNVTAGTTNPPPPPPGTTTPPQTGTWSAQATNTSGQTGNQLTIPVSVTAGTAVSDSIVDVEVYDSGNNRALQKFFEHQNFSANQTQQFSVPWTPNNQGTYNVSVGVFNNNWSQNYYWTSNAGTVTVTQGTPTNPPPPPPGTTTPPSNPPPTGTYNTNIWWPSEGASLNGVQPLKANIDNLDVSQYHMFWQVDGGTLNEMSNSSTDYPHKESLVDFTGWNWKGQGPYNLNFLSKDNGGSQISSKSVNIYVR